MKKIYLSGPMRGYTNNNFAAFDAAKKYFTSFGAPEATVVSPADLDRDAGFDGDNNDDVHIREFAKRDLAAVLDCDVIYMLRGWEKSIGARAEHAAAIFGELEIWYE